MQEVVISNELEWLTTTEAWKDQVRWAATQTPALAFATFRKLAGTRMDFVRTGALDLAVQRYVSQNGAPAGLAKIKLALLASSTVAHLHAGIRMGALRRGVFIELHEGDYGMYQRDIMDESSALYAFKPEVVCLALDAHHLTNRSDASADRVLAQLGQLWGTLLQRLACAVIQQTVLPVFWPTAGNQENRLAESPASMVLAINAGLRNAAANAGIYLLTADTWAAQNGISHWHDPVLWFRSKQEIHPRASALYGDQFGRVLAALKGLSAKCLVLDLDNTLWGGVIGDDGIEGIVLGQGSTVGEAHVALQQYALQLSRRGVILAVCSKNDEKTARAPFEQHDDMVLRPTDIACFVANWKDKATNLRHIAHALNIGLDSMVFVDDNPAERALVRRELPMVHVPELPEDVAGYVPLLASAGYFEVLDITVEDRQRTEAYRANAGRESLRSATTDMEGYLRALQMRLTWSAFMRIDLQRIVQLANKTNQFNLTSRRYSEAEVLDLMAAPDCFTLQLRLADIYGDNGIIGLVMGRRQNSGALDIETWLMSCRVLGRRVEQATLTIVVQEATRMGCNSLTGTYKPTEKNGMVRQHYSSLGFTSLAEDSDGLTRWALPLSSYAFPTVPIDILKGELCTLHTSIAA